MKVLRVGSRYARNLSNPPVVSRKPKKPIGLYATGSFCGF